MPIIIETEQDITRVANMKQRNNFFIQYTKSFQQSSTSRTMDLFDMISGNI